MRTYKLFGAILGCLALLSSCGQMSHLTDDDVYITKAPALTESSASNDINSYENYKYNYRRSNVAINYAYGDYFYFNRGMIGFLTWREMWYMDYSPFRGSFYSPGIYSADFGSAMYFQYGNWDSYYGNPWYYGGIYGYSPYGYGFSYNPYYTGCQNFSGNQNGFGNQSYSLNFHQGPRNSLGGKMSSGGRSHSVQAKGMTVASTGRGSYNQVGSRTTSSTERTTSPRVGGDSRISSREVKSGTGMSGTTRNVSTSTTNRSSSSSTGTRSSSGGVDNSRSSGSSGSSNHVPSSTRSNGNSGGSGGSSTPRSGGGTVHTGKRGG